MKYTRPQDNPESHVLGSVEGKIRAIAADFTDFEYMFADYSQANVRLDRIKKPTILYVLPPSGTLDFRSFRHDVVDSPEVQLWFLCPTKFDFKSAENECRVEAMKRAGIMFIDAINKSELFEPIDGSVPYQVAYDAFDANLTGICLKPSLKELTGIRLCDNR